MKKHVKPKELIFWHKKLSSKIHCRKILVIFLPLISVPCKFKLHSNGNPIFPKDVLAIDYCERRNVDPKRPWMALRNVANGHRCGCYFLKPCERWDYKAFSGFTVKNAAPLIALPLIKKPSKCLARCDDQRHKQCKNIPKFAKEGIENCVCKECCLMTTHRIGWKNEKLTLIDDPKLKLSLKIYYWVRKFFR